jgi:hypothetical protein
LRQLVVAGGHQLANWRSPPLKHHGSGLFDPVVRDIDPANAVKGMFGFDFLCAK